MTDDQIAHFVEGIILQVDNNQCFSSLKFGEIIPQGSRREHSGCRPEVSSTAAYCQRNLYWRTKPDGREQFLQDHDLGLSTKIHLELEDSRSPELGGNDHLDFHVWTRGHGVIRR